MRKGHLCLLLLAIITFFGSCVSKSTYKALETTMVKKENELLNNRQQIRSLREDTLRMGNMYRATVVEKRQLENYNTYSQSRLYEELNKLQAQLDEKQGALIAKEKKVQEQESVLKEKENLLGERTKKLNALQSKIESQNRLVHNLRLSVADALSEFNEDDLSLEVKDGKVYVSVAEELLFSSGSTRVKSEGERALMRLANVLSQNQSFYVTVEGHTDNVKPSGGKDNWDLSVLRATSVVRLLVKGGMNPSKVTPSGKGEFKPVVLNDTTENKSKNRRTEIILAPDMSLLYDLLKMY